MPFTFQNLRSGVATVSSESQFSEAVLSGLSRTPKRLPSWLIFDDRGSDIFTEITQLPGYHPARSEYEIFHAHKQELSNLLEQKHFRVIELGAGDGGKTEILLEHFSQHGLNFEYVPIDISEGAVKKLVSALELKYCQSSMSVKGIAADYFDGLSEIGKEPTVQNLVLFLGSTIGNMEFPVAKKFVRKVGEALKEGDYIMIGFDLMKHPKTLYTAYNDLTGVFERFNLHLLDVLNQKLGANFEKQYYVQQGQYNPGSHAVESFIYSTREQAVKFTALGKVFSFGAWEAMQTEHSYKYTLGEIEALAEQAGCRVVRHLFDVDHHFVDSVWKVT